VTPERVEEARGFAALPDGGRLAYEVRGRAHGGIPVLLIRPLGGSMPLWGRFREYLAQSFCVVAFDLRGTGHSSPDPGLVTTRGLADDARVLLDDLGIPLAHVFGISLGGMTATWLAILAPSRVARLCIASAPARGVELTRSGIRRELGLAACLARPLHEVERSLVDRILSRGFRESHPHEVARVEAALRVQPASRTGLLKHALAGVLHDARRDLGRVVAPTLVLAGEKDHLLAPSSARALAAAIPHATFEIIAGCGHDLTLEEPEVTSSRVGEFFGS
jgi:pimeloyl-ACP methyl ester carboxylesterase